MINSDYFKDFKDSLSWEYLKKKHFSSFVYLNISQFLGVLNDNIFKLLIVFFLIDLHGIAKSAAILSKAGAIFVLPFLLFSTTAGQLADRVSKRDIIVITKALEIFVMMLGFIMFVIKSSLGAYVTLFLMASQSSFFSPAKYGIVPEIVREEEISKANSQLTTLTFLAMIFGTFLASFLTDFTARNFIISSLVCLFFAIIGYISSLYIEKTKAAGHKRKLSGLVFYDIYKCLRLAKHHNRLFSAILGGSFFLFLGAYVQLNIIPFAMESLNLSDAQGGYLFLLTALGIGLGSLCAGSISGKDVELGLTPIAGFGMCVSCFGLYLYEKDLTTVLLIMVLIGFFGGLWIVPFDSFIQVASPKKFRGQMVATGNFLSFIGVLIASAFLYFCGEILNLKAAQGFLIITILIFIVSICLSFAIMDYFLRFMASKLTQLFFRIEVEGFHDVPKRFPSLIICKSQSSWLDILLLSGLQKPPLRFFIERKKKHALWLKMLSLFFRFTLFPSQNSMKRRKNLYQKTLNALKKGDTVFLFCESKLDKYIEDFDKILDQTPYLIIPVKIEEKILAWPPKAKISFKVNY